MRYWWVNQNKTFQYEVPGGYLWSPKVNKNGHINPYYETMREVACGDLVFSFKNRRIMALGLAQHAAYTCPKPLEFGSAGIDWNDIGWRVDIAFHCLKHQILPKQHMQLLKPLIPKKYSPIREDGDGNQIYLAEISQLFAEVLVGLIGFEAESLLASARQQEVQSEGEQDYLVNQSDLMLQWDEAQVDAVQRNTQLGETEKQQVIKSRRGQGVFRRRVLQIESHCRVTRVDRAEHLIASHIKPWKVADNVERLDGENGLMLTPSIDHLFGEGYISFQKDGGVILSPIANTSALNKMGIVEGDRLNVGRFSRSQSQYLEYHQDSILLKARR